MASLPPRWRFHELVRPEVDGEVTWPMFDRPRGEKATLWEGKKFVGTNGSQCRMDAFVRLRVQRRMY